MYLIDFIHPIAGEFKHQLTGLHCSRHGGGVQRAGSSLKYPGWDYSASFSAQRDASQNGYPVVVLLLFSDLGAPRERERERERPRAKFQRSAVVQVGAASYLCDTEAGSLVHQHLAETERQIVVRRHI